MAWQRGKARGTKKRESSAAGGLSDTWIDGHVAHVRVRYIHCGKPGCKKKHGPYKYLVYRQGKKIKEKYLGKAEE